MAKILVIDDDSQICRMIKRILKKEHHQVDIAEDGRQGMVLLESRSPDILITDILMPEVDGIDIINHYRHKNKDVKIIAISGGRRKITAEFNLHSATLLGADATLAKPFSRDQLLHTINGFLES